MVHWRIATFERHPQFQDKDLDCLCIDALLDNIIPPSGSNERMRQHSLIPDDILCEDTASLASFSTNATEGNIPGPGRIIDMYIYQRLGRVLERFASKMALQHNCSFLTPSPGRITEYFIDLHPGTGFGFIGNRALKNIVNDISISTPDGPALIVGLKSLVNQSQSTSVYRAAGALAGLIRISISSHPLLSQFYDAVSRDEPIFALEKLAEKIEDSHLGKAYLLSLVSIGRASLLVNLMASNSSPPSNFSPIAPALKRRLLNVLELWRSSRFDSVLALGKACLLFAEAFTYKNFWRESTESTNLTVFEIAYLTSIFLVHAIIIFYHRVIHEEHAMSQLERLFLVTLVHWFDTVVCSGIWAFSDLPMDNVELIRQVGKFRSIFYVVCETDHKFLFPQSLYSIHDNFPRPFVLPRRIRDKPSWDREPPMNQGYAPEWMRTSRTLLSSLDELQRYLQAVVLTKEADADRPQTSDTRNQVSIAELQCALRKAATSHVLESQITKEFLDARDISTSPVEDPLTRWAWYKRKCQRRHRWGTLLRSNLDWDWDLAGYMRRLFEDVEIIQNSHHYVETSVEVQGDTLRFQQIITGGLALKRIELPFVSEAGELKYRTFTAYPSTEDNSGIVEVLHPPT